MQFLKDGVQTVGGGGGGGGGRLGGKRLGGETSCDHLSYFY